MFAGSTIRERLILALAMTIAVTSISCAAFRPTDVNGPTANAPQYPITLSDVGSRLEEASVAWLQLSQRYGLPGKTEANLQPYTGTIQSLPANLSAPIRLPKVSTQATPTEEETRESLRRFIVEWQRLIGADPNELSLVERTDDPSGIKLARYEQRPFRYPLRGGFGNLIIRFRTDGQLVEFSSTCIPNADRVQAALAGLTPKLTSDDAVNHVKTGNLTVTDANGRQQTLSLPASAVVEAKQMVVYAQPPPDRSTGLQIRLAWEVDVTNGPVSKVYLDAISGETIAAS